MTKLKKIDLYIVEGLSDEAYLRPLTKHLEKLDNKVKVKVTYGDITTNIYSNHKKEILDRIHNVVLGYLEDKSFEGADYSKSWELIKDSKYAFLPKNNINVLALEYEMK